MEGEGERERGGERGGARSDEGWEGMGRVGKGWGGVGRDGEVRTRQVEEGGVTSGGGRRR